MACIISACIVEITYVFINKTELTKLTFIQIAYRLPQTFLFYSRADQCVKSVCIWSCSGPCFPAFELNTEICRINLHIQSEYEKIRTRKTPHTDIFRAVILSSYKDKPIDKFLYAGLNLILALNELRLVSKSISSKTQFCNLQWLNLISTSI